MKLRRPCSMILSAVIAAVAASCCDSAEAGFPCRWNAVRSCRPYRARGRVPQAGATCPTTNVDSLSATETASVSIIHRTPQPQSVARSSLLPECQGCLNEYNNTAQYIPCDNGRYIYHLNLSMGISHDDAIHNCHVYCGNEYPGSGDPGYRACIYGCDHCP